ncbi:MAG: hypothetical protein ACI8RD_011723 [Bacillariaceae sp.]|jgi:hypothetical protein
MARALYLAQSNGMSFVCLLNVLLLTLLVTELLTYSTTAMSLLKECIIGNILYEVCHTYHKY